MPTYVVFTNLTDQGRKTVRDNPLRIKEVNAELESMGVKIKDQYAVFGPYDFVNIMEAANDGVLARALIQFASRGTGSTMTLPAKSTEEWIKLLQG